MQRTTTKWTVRRTFWVAICAAAVVGLLVFAMGPTRIISDPTIPNIQVNIVVNVIDPRTGGPVVGALVMVVASPPWLEERDRFLALSASVFDRFEEYRNVDSGRGIARTDPNGHGSVALTYRDYAQAGRGGQESTFPETIEVGVFHPEIGVKLTRLINPERESVRSPRGSAVDFEVDLRPVRVELRPW